MQFKDDALWAEKLITLLGVSKMSNASAYRCPVCHMESRVSDKTDKKGDNVARTIRYNCGTVMVILQNGFRFKQNITKSEKCIESVLVAV